MEREGILTHFGWRLGRVLTKCSWPLRRLHCVAFGHEPFCPDGYFSEPCGPITDRERCHVCGLEALRVEAE